MSNAALNTQTPQRFSGKWETRRIGDIFSIRAGSSKSQHIVPGGRYIIIDMGSVATDGRLILSKHTDHKSDFLKEGDLVMPKDDIGGGKIIGKVAYIDANRLYVLGDHVYALRLIEGYPKFYSYLINRYETNKSLKSKVAGSAQLGLSRKAVEEQEVPVPNHEEQRAIAEALSDVDGLLNTLEALIEKKRAVKQATMQQLLTGKTRLPEFSGTLETKRLGEIASFFKGSGLSKADLSLDGKRRCIHYGELFTTYGECITEILHGTDRGGTFFLSLHNDVLMPGSDVTPNGLATASCISIPDVILGGDILVIRAPVDVLNGTFLAYVIEINHNQVMQLVSGTTVYHLYGRDMANFSFLAPGIEEQQAIVSVLSDMDAEIAALEQRRDKTRAIKQGMMQQLLTGRVRLIRNGVG